MKLHAIIFTCGKRVRVIRPSMVGILKGPQRPPLKWTPAINNQITHNFLGYLCSLDVIGCDRHRDKSIELLQWATKRNRNLISFVFIFGCEAGKPYILVITFSHFLLAASLRCGGGVGILHTHPVPVQCLQ